MGWTPSRRLTLSAEAEPPDEVRLRKARKTLADFWTLWRDPEMLDRMREEAVAEMFARFDVDGYIEDDLGCGRQFRCRVSFGSTQQFEREGFPASRPAPDPA